ncbi:N-acetyltransferase [Sinorhizobium meliloti]|uniref:GNAT family N-acetyltransferase n=1 Tax=Rhizobium meliloti TaxID=382 RepID=UPI000FD90117|nr:GNAT family N-acetyltransferase [Sinorhizobium meliloti]RVI06065.1 N-acetyltransferase [Sinorhizobium meliloti]
MLHWLDIDYRTLFRLGDGGRIERENDPEGSPGPGFWLAGCAEGNIFGVRTDVPEDIAEELERLVADEPPFTHPGIPKHLGRYLPLLGGSGPVKYNFGLIYELPHALAYEGRARLIESGTGEGRELTRTWAANGVPQGLFDLGFHDVTDLWEPWCAAAAGDEIASIAFAARRSDAGAELGLVTAKAFRGQGLGAAATAGWSRLPELRSRTLFYSTDRENHASQRVAARLGLRLRGASLRVG